MARERRLDNNAGAVCTTDVPGTLSTYAAELRGCRVQTISEPAAVRLAYQHSVSACGATKSDQRALRHGFERGEAAWLRTKHRAHGRADAARAVVRECHEPYGALGDLESRGARHRARESNLTRRD